MTREKLGDVAILFVCIVAAVLSGLWGLDEAPREYGLLLVVSVIGAVLMSRKIISA